MQGPHQTFDILWGVVLMLLHHKRLDLGAGDTPEFLGPKRRQEMVAHDAPEDAPGRRLARDRDIVRQPLLGIVTKEDGLGSGVRSPTSPSVNFASSFRFTSSAARLLSPTHFALRCP